jgi:hypothetical protein
MTYSIDFSVCAFILLTLWGMAKRGLSFLKAKNSENLPEGYIMVPLTMLFILIFNFLSQWWYNTALSIMGINYSLNFVQTLVVSYFISLVTVRSKE